MVGIAIGEDRAVFQRRVTALQDAFALEPEKREGWVEARRERMILGTPDEARAMVGRYADAGIERLMLQDFLPFDLEMVDLMAAELIGRA
jgi:alkanesulfonate monooxygenase SsuD/methylene tetrahydromethanopterin reductase-like flavin-dependent oxidoreductase (luciferase family)